MRLRHENNRRYGATEKTLLNHAVDEGAEVATPRLLAIPFQELSDSFEFDLEMLVMAKIKDLRVVELPIPIIYGTEVPHLNPILLLNGGFIFKQYHSYPQNLSISVLLRNHSGLKSPQEREIVLDRGESAPFI